MQRFFLPELPIAGGQTYEESGLLVGSDGNACFPPFAKARRMGHPALAYGTLLSYLRFADTKS